MEEKSEKNGRTTNRSKLRSPAIEGVRSAVRAVVRCPRRVQDAVERSAKRTRSVCGKLLNEYLVSPVAKATDSTVAGISSVLYGTFVATISVIAFIATISVLVFSALAFYIFLYRTFIPEEMEHSRPLYFNFSRFEGPVATIDLLSPHEQWFGAASGVANVPLQQRNLLRSKLSTAFEYDFFVSLELPDSEVNGNIGMFMITLQLLALDGTLLAHSARPAMLSYRSNLMRLYQSVTGVLKYALFLGPSSTNERISLEMIDLFAPSSTAPVTTLIAKISNSALQLKSASVRWIIRLRGLSYILYHYWLSSMIVCVVVGVVVQATLAGVIIASLSAIVRQRELEVLEDERALSSAADQFDGATLEGDYRLPAAPLRASERFVSASSIASDEDNRSRIPLDFDELRVAEKMSENDDVTYRSSKRHDDRDGDSGLRRRRRVNAKEEDKNDG